MAKVFNLGKKQILVESEFISKEGKINFPLLNVDMSVRDDRYFIFKSDFENCIVLVKHNDLTLLNMINIPEDYITVITFTVVTKKDVKYLYVFFDCDLDRYDDMIAFLKEYDFEFI